MTKNIYLSLASLPQLNMTQVIHLKWRHCQRWEAVNIRSKYCVFTDLQVVLTATYIDNTQLTLCDHYLIMRLKPLGLHTKLW